MSGPRALAALLLSTIAQPLAGADPRILAVGDIACSPGHASYNGGQGIGNSCRQMATSDLALAHAPGLDGVLLLGDLQYETGAHGDFLAVFGASWGRLGELLRPLPGNHEYGTAGAAGYFAYFGAAAGDPTEGWYSFDLGAWHAVMLNSNCGAVGGCGEGSAQLDWLRQDLRDHPADCTLVAWHHPRFASGAGHGSHPHLDPFWRALMEGGADVVLSGHEHNFERFSRLDAEARHDVVRGPRQFVVGTGGRNLYGFDVPQPGSATRIAALGALLLTLKPSSYDWEFRGLGDTVLASGSAACHPAPRGFHPLAPCRLLDTRLPAGAPALDGSARTVVFAGRCGIPADAEAVAANWTVVSPTRSGTLEVWPTGGFRPGTAVAGLRSGSTRAAWSVLALGDRGALDVDLVTSAPATAHLVIDVSGYFR